MITSNSDIKYLLEYGDSYEYGTISVATLVAAADMSLPINQLWVDLEPIVNDDAIRRCPSCQTMFLEDPVMYENPNLCPACGMSLTSKRPINY